MCLVFQIYNLFGILYNIRVSNSLDLGQAYLILLGLNLIQTVCKVYQLMTKYSIGG